MREKIKNEFPKWVNEINSQYNLILSNDIDSLMSCCLLNYLFQTKITHFYNFKAIYTTDEKAKNLIGVDIAFSNNFKVFDNHVTRIDKNDKVNILSANLNAIYNISRENYYKKYCGSTLLQIWSLYDVPLPKTEEGKMILLAIDSSFKGHYIEKFKK